MLFKFGVGGFVFEKVKVGKGCEWCEGEIWGE